MGGVLAAMAIVSGIAFYIDLKATEKKRNAQMTFALETLEHEGGISNSNTAPLLPQKLTYSSKIHF